MKKILLWVGILAMAMVVFSSNVWATGISYVTGPNEPWNVPHNQQAMDKAFGTGNWNQFTFSNAIGSGILTNTGFIYIDGGDYCTAGFTSFVDTNRIALEDWVTGGGSLFLNAARVYDYPDLDMGFDVTLHHEFEGTYSRAASAIDPTHTIFTGPNDAGTSWTGNYFAHEYVTGTDLTDLISGYTNEGGNYVGNVLGEKDYGLGHLMVGGMTSSYWHNPDPYADNLRANILKYGADCAAAPIPEPATCFLLGTGLAGLTIAKKRKKKK